MNHESGESSDDIVQSPRAVCELQGLKDVIALTLFQAVETPPKESRMQTVYPDTDHAVIRQMWPVEQFDDSAVWLDETGDLWYVSTGSPGFNKPLDLAIQDEVGLINCKTLVLSFMAQLSP